MSRVILSGLSPLSQHLILCTEFPDVFPESLNLDYRGYPSERLTIWILGPSLPKQSGPCHLLSPHGLLNKGGFEERVALLKKSWENNC